ncbi:putative cysteine protease atg4 [Xylona heveae TC161]|uniref:Cysteine protease n=1 Tax=Xylona heveae (strain CBS 132557 / TC161) TaxID=1328760 RepID=A0A164ZB73_XYLHT|nr:putative cysteine protease atg4 [Xylona heveae TC161]KZF18889.1 putative cysteine protease atg4 [Xylona heveae TC161]
MTSPDLGRYKRFVRYFWDPEPENDDISGTPIWCLGREYVSSASTCNDDSFETKDDQLQSAPAEGNVTSNIGGDATHCFNESRRESVGGWPPSFLDDFESKIWLTYRSNFPLIPKSRNSKATSNMTLSVRLRSHLLDPSGFTSDTGWGCMIRSGQSLLINTLVILRLGRDWRRGSGPIEERRILSLFADDPDAPFSIHRFVEHGATACGKHPGEWFGPSATAHCIDALVNELSGIGLKVYVTGDGDDIYEDRLMKVATTEDGTFTPTLLLVGIRLGIDRVTPLYWESLKSSLTLSQSVGIAGGRPSSSHYFVGVQGSSFFYLDPHQTRPALPLHLNPEDYTEAEVDSCHTRRLRKLRIGEMDPSMLIGFLIRDEADWISWRERISKTPGKAIVNIASQQKPVHGQELGRDDAIDEVEPLDDEYDDDIGP